jgi:ABC-type sulfate/molybdate transport systems ATPase subunit
VVLQDATVQPARGRTRLGPIDCEIRPGDWWILVAPPDSGKSTLLAAIAGLLPLSSGTLTQPQPDHTSPPPHPLPPVPLVFENGGHLLHRLTVAENIALPLQYHRNLAGPDAARQIEPLLALTGVTHLAHRTPGNLKPAQRQRVALARALALQPHVILLDNPTAGLPPPEIAWWQETLRQLHLGQTPALPHPLTLVLACEDPTPWWTLGSRFVLVDHGTWTDLGSCPDTSQRDAITNALHNRA